MGGFGDLAQQIARASMDVSATSPVVTARLPGAAGRLRRTHEASVTRTEWFAFWYWIES